MSSVNSVIEPTQVVNSDGSNVDPATSLPLRDEDIELRELTLAHRGIARAPKNLKTKSEYPYKYRLMSNVCTDVAKFIIWEDTISKFISTVII